MDSTLFSKYFARFMVDLCRLSDAEKVSFNEIMMQLCAVMEEGSICLRLDSGQEELLARSRLVATIGNKPFAVYRGRLYLQRYFQYLQRLARQLAEMAARRQQPNVCQVDLSSYFPSLAEGLDDQAEAARLALQQTLTIICGGPGTGKTTTVVKIIALMMQAAGKPLAIALAAPTGKAAGRLSQSLGASLDRLDLADRLKDVIPRQAQTLHRLLGVRRHSPQFRHNHDYPLPYDLVVVDEASMVDLALLSKLVDSLSPDCRLLLLGDKDQLASVESGAGLGELIAGLPDCCRELRKTYRFDAAIKSFAAAINSEDNVTGWQLLTGSLPANVSLLDSNYLQYIAGRYVKLLHMANAATPTAAAEQLVLMQSFMVLCSVRLGERGVDGINRAVESALVREGLPCRPGGWYVGRPVLITENDYNLGLYNGDIGVCLRDSRNNELLAWFEQIEGRPRGFPVSLLPAAETAYALTIHKSQGSEFEEVVVVLPGVDSPVLSRELLYTAVTRAKKAVRLVADEDIFAVALARHVQRESGLGEEIAILRQQYGGGER
jgi:exodeoxyribonuclease V alpha subunit